CVCVCVCVCVWEDVESWCNVPEAHDCFQKYMYVRGVSLCVNSTCNANWPVPYKCMTWEVKCEYECERVDWCVCVCVPLLFGGCSAGCWLMFHISAQSPVCPE